MSKDSNLVKSWSQNPRREVWLPIGLENEEGIVRLVYGYRKN